MFCGDSGSGPAGAGIRGGMGDELAHESVVVLECDHTLVFVACDRLVELDLLLDQSLDPEADGAGQDRKGSYGYLPSALSPAASIRPGEERENASRIALLITEVEVIGRRVVEVYGTLDEPEPENAGVEVEIPLRVTGYASDMVNTGCTETHRPDSCLVFLRILALVGARTGRPALARLGRRSTTLFLLSLGCHNISDS